MTSTQWIVIEAALLRPCEAKSLGTLSCHVVENVNATAGSPGNDDSRNYGVPSTTVNEMVTMIRAEEAIKTRTYADWKRKMARGAGGRFEDIG